MDAAAKLADLLLAACARHRPLRLRQPHYVRVQGMRRERANGSVDCGCGGGKGGALLDDGNGDGGKRRVQQLDRRVDELAKRRHTSNRAVVHPDEGEAECVNQRNCRAGK